MKTYILLLLLLIYNQTTHSQNSETIKIIGLDYLTKDFSFDGNEKTTEAVFEVDEKIKFLDFSFIAKITKGTLAVSILDPNERDEGQFELVFPDSESRKYEKEVMGQINKRIDNPIFGTWKIKITSIKAEGTGLAKIFNNNVKD